VIEFIAFFLLGVCAGTGGMLYFSLALHHGAIAIANWYTHRKFRWFYQAIERMP